MNILTVCSVPFPPQEGIGNHIKYVAKSLIKYGHEVTIATRGCLNYCSSKYEDINIIKTPFVPIYPYHVDFHGKILSNYINNNINNYDIVHIHSPLVPYLKIDLPIVTTLHSSLVEDIKFVENRDVYSALSRIMTHAISKQIIQKQLNNSKAILAVSRSLQKELIQHYGYSKSVLIGNGVDINEFIPGNKNIQLNFNEYILFIGRLSYGKGIIDLIRAFSNVKRNNLKLYLCGHGKLKKELIKLVYELKIENKIVFFDYVEHSKLITLIQGALMVVIPSRYETGPLVLLEAMSCGKSVITTNVGLASEIIEDGKNGCIIPIGSPNIMAEKIEYLCSDDKARSDIGKRARQTMVDQYSWDVVARRVEKCYQFIMDG